jgi:hypothetical protein
MVALIPWLVFLHILSVLMFFLAHGTAVAMAFQLRKETELARIRAMLDLSASTFSLMSISFLGLGISGLIMPFILKIWDKGWIWTSMVLMVIVTVQMSFMNEKRYKHLRRLVGLPYMMGIRQFAAEPPAGQEAVQTLIKEKLKVGELVGVGIVIPIIVLWLMVFKPF